jgi:hypothetical protein
MFDFIAIFLGNTPDVVILVSIGKLMLIITALFALWRIGDGILTWHKAFVLLINDHNKLMRDYYERHPHEIPDTPKAKSKGAS